MRYVRLEEVRRMSRERMSKKGVSHTFTQRTRTHATHRPSLSHLLRKRRRIEGGGGGGRRRRKVNEPFIEISCSSHSYDSPYTEYLELNQIALEGRGR